MPLRLTWTGIACSASVIRISVAVVFADLHHLADDAERVEHRLLRYTPSSAPLLMTIMWRNGCTETLMISAMSVRSLTPLEASRISRSRRFSSLSASRRSSLRTCRAQLFGELRRFRYAGASGRRSCR